LPELSQAYIYEIFSGIQGEGIYIGERELFIRFCGCNLACPYCDTKYALTYAPTCLVEKRAGTREFDAYPNPIGVGELIGFLAPLLEKERLYHSIFLTGGEPLLWNRFLALFLPQVRRSFNLPITLETNGTLPSELASVLQWIDIVSMDYKLPSTMGGEDYSDEHREFLRLVKDKDVFLKFVITSSVSFEEMKEAFRILREVGDFPVIIQPVTPSQGIMPPDEVLLLKIQELGKEFFSIVRVIPQMHKLMGAR